MMSILDWQIIHSRQRLDWRRTIRLLPDFPSYPGISRHDLKPHSKVQMVLPKVWRKTLVTTEDRVLDGDRPAICPDGGFLVGTISLLLMESWPLE